MFYSLASFNRPLQVNTNDVITIGSDTFLQEFLMTPTWNDSNSNPIWNKFLMKINPEDDSNTRALSLKLSSDSETCYYSPCPGFDLEKTPCSSWLSWHLLTTASGQAVQILKILPGTNLNDPRLETLLTCPFRDSHVPRLDSLPRRDFRKRNYNRSDSPPPRRRRYQYNDQEAETNKPFHPQQMQYYNPPQMTTPFAAPTFYNPSMAIPPNSMPQLMYPMPQTKQ